jgi:predicted NBD/HSP70 family sugar kinase
MEANASCCLAAHEKFRHAEDGADGRVTLTAIVLALTAQAPSFTVTKDGRIEATQVFKAAAKGDREAHKIIGRAMEAMASGLAGLVNILDLDTLILGGGVIKGRPGLLRGIDQRTRSYLMTAEARRDLRIVPESAW